jgi:hypothetical protein
MVSTAATEKMPFAAASWFQISPLTDSNRHPLLTMERRTQPVAAEGKDSACFCGFWLRPICG